MRWRPAACHFGGRVSVQPLMHAMGVVVVLEGLQLLLQILGVPEEQMIQILPTDGPDESFHKGMRNRRIGHSSDWQHLEDSEVGCPLAVLEEGIMSMLRTRTTGPLAQ